MTREPTQRSRRAGGDEGAALVEFAFVAVLLCLLVFGIINFGLILSFKQDMTRAAAEGARAGAVAPPGSTSAPTTAFTAAKAATDEAVDGFDKQCGVDGMTCVVHRHDCSVDMTTSLTPSDDPAGDCITVNLVYDYDNHPLLAELPLLSAALPDVIKDSSVARVNT